MKNAFKVVGVSAFALALAFSGCGKDKKSSSGSSLKSDSGGGSRARAERVRGPMEMAEIKSEANTMSMCGRKIFMGMIQANIDRPSGAGSVWPRTEDKDQVRSSDDIASHVSRSATDYFSALFDMEHYGTSEWDPNVDGELLSALGKSAVSGKTIRAAGLDWCIAANIRDEIFDDLPVLISANFNPAFLLREYDGRDDTPLPIGPESGAEKSMFNDEAIVVVRKGGAAEVIKKKYLTYDVLYKRTAFDLTDFSPPLKYFTPTGVVEPIGYGAWARAERFRGSRGRGDIRGEASVQPCSPSPAPELPEDDEDDEKFYGKPENDDKDDKDDVKKKEPPKSFP